MSTADLGQDAKQAGGVSPPWYRDPFAAYCLYFAIALIQPRFFPGMPAWPYAMVAILLATFLLVLQGPKVFRDFKPGILGWSMVVLIVVMLPAMVKSLNHPVGSVWMNHTYLPLMLSTCLMVLMLREPRHWNWFCYTVFGSLAALVLYYNLQSFLQGGRFVLHHDGHGVFDTNLAAIMFCFFLPCAWWAWHQRKKWWWRGGILFLLAAHVNVIMMCYSRTGLIVYAVIGLILIAMHKPRREAFTLLAVAALFIIILAGPEVVNLINALPRALTDQTLDDRFWLWAQGWEVLLANPLGVGARMGTLRPVHQHYLQFAMDFGWLAGFVWIWLQGFAAWRFIGLIRSGKQAAYEQGITLLCLLTIMILSSLMFSLESFLMIWTLYVFAMKRDLCLPQTSEADQPEQVVSSED